MNQPPSYAGRYNGLSDPEITARLKTYGYNILPGKRFGNFFRLAKELLTEPMLLLLALACFLYLLLGEKGEALMMLGGISIMVAISLYQQIKSSRATAALNKLTAHAVKVIREGKETYIASADLVPDDLMLLEEGMNIPADGVIVQHNDLTVNESAISGESVSAEKDEGDKIFMGTMINTGSCLVKVTATGYRTELGKIGKSIDEYTGSKSLLQLQISGFVKKLALFGFIGFCLIFLLNYLHYREAVPALLFALTLAMSVIPEEIPVAFSSFMALGAYKMSQMGIICRQPQVIENIGAMNILCFDKTGTITENKMEVKMLAVAGSDKLTVLPTEQPFQDGSRLLKYARLASEEKPFDAMEKAICEAYDLYSGEQSSSQYRKVYDYPLQGKPPMMTHIYEGAPHYIAAGKGAPERILDVCKTGEAERAKIMQQVVTMAAEGYRVLAVATSSWSSANFPQNQSDYPWIFAGLLGLYDPPKPGMKKVIAGLYTAGVKVKILTGDHPATAMNIGGRIGMNDCTKYVSGEDVMNADKNTLQHLVNEYDIFARMFPEAKLKVIRELKDQNNVVAMTGDGVNDGPALKASSIGIAMGKNGTGIARQAADLILTSDDPGVILKAIGEGRKIFINLKKALRYIISIHIPILLIAVVPVLLSWKFPNIFTPIHIIFLELIMGPTCSVFFEKEPAEFNNLLQSPRKVGTALFTRSETGISILQGMMIAISCLGLYLYFMQTGSSIELIRTIVLVTLIISNLLLTFINRSFSATIFETIHYKNPLARAVILMSAVFLLLLLCNEEARNIFNLSSLSPGRFFLCLAAATVGTGWFEVYKKIARPGRRAIEKTEKR